MTPATLRPRLIVVAGPNGSGKTSITEQLLMHQWMQGCVYVNPDFIARDQFGDWNAPAAILQAAEQSQEIRERCLRDRQSLAFETVLSSPDKVDFIKRAKAAGFFVRLFFVGTNDPTINAKRVALRVLEGGHDVPIPKIIARYTRSLAFGAVVAQMADRAYFYDNSVEDQAARLLFRVADSQLVKIYGPLYPWAQAIAEQIPR
ncbi:zeta toxin family protein [Azovibrio restrictus]|uniref:zeta toxin family protein n=1 Tax=Azovibrio restrictus TaxID=146938 RepID=UPI0026EF7EBD|nr:zeta toxin family protein [Azovibrio restrictus]MDD3483764.1 zeta toxin family protein [Azovibrio restrictus]